MNLVGEQESNLWLCRICLKPEGDDEFRAFYGNNCKTAIKVHKITGVKVCKILQNLFSIFYVFLYFLDC